MKNKTEKQSINNSIAQNTILRGVILLVITVLFFILELLWSPSKPVIAAFVLGAFFSMLIILRGKNLKRNYGPLHVIYIPIFIIVLYLWHVLISSYPIIISTQKGLMIMQILVISALLIWDIFSMVRLARLKNGRGLGLNVIFSLLIGIVLWGLLTFFLTDLTQTEDFFYRQNSSVFTIIATYVSPFLPTILIAFVPVYSYLYFVLKPNLPTQTKSSIAQNLIVFSTLVLAVLTYPVPIGYEFYKNIFGIYYNYPCGESMCTPHYIKADNLNFTFKTISKGKYTTLGRQSDRLIVLVSGDAGTKSIHEYDVENIDIDSLESVDDNPYFIKDKSNVYHIFTKDLASETDTIYTLDLNPQEVSIMNDYYIKDNDRVFYNNSLFLDDGAPYNPRPKFFPVENADGKTFKALPDSSIGISTRYQLDSHIGYDKNSVIAFGYVTDLSPKGIEIEGCDKDFDKKTESWNYMINLINDNGSYTIVIDEDKFEIKSIIEN